MMVPFAFVILSVLVLLTSGSPVSLSHTSVSKRATIAPTDYDVIVIGGGPAGLSALSALGRIRRKAVLFDSGVYRNAATRHMHDVIGNDGTVPSAFRALARQQISRYPSVSFINTTISSIDDVGNGSYFVATDVGGMNYTARKVILGTGVLDVVPQTPGFPENWGKGMFWCPFCDGWENRDRPMGVLGPFNKETIGNAIEIQTLNTDVVILTNGTYTQAAQDAATASVPKWQAELAALNVGIENRTIAALNRLNGSQTQDGYDQFEVVFTDGGSIVRDAFFVNFPTKLNGDLPVKMGLNLTKNRIAVDDSMLTNMNGVYAVGDVNSDGSTNVVHAMFSGKRAGVKVHVALDTDTMAALVGKREPVDEEKLLENRDLEELWDSLRTDSS